MTTQAIYEPKGAAREYCKLAVNLYKGCSHGCWYCYAPNATHRKYEDFIKSSPRSGILEALKHDTARLHPYGQEILLCFTCDPYQPIELEYRLTRQAIEIIHNYGHHVRILTKGGNRALEDIEKHFLPDDWFGVSLTYLSEDDTKNNEPGAAPVAERLLSLYTAYHCGWHTWVSLEPVIDPAQSLALIEFSYRWVDHFYVGKLNHVENETDWRKFATDASTLLERLGKKYTIKNDLKKYLEMPKGEICQK